MVDKHTEEFFSVEGAGELKVGTNSNAWCGQSVGFTVGVSWGSNGFAGGVLDRNEAKRLADMIYKALGSDMKPRSEVMRIR